MKVAPTLLLKVQICRVAPALLLKVAPVLLLKIPPETQVMALLLVRVPLLLRVPDKAMEPEVEATVRDLPALIVSTLPALNAWLTFMLQAPLPLMMIVLPKGKMGGGIKFPTQLAGSFQLPVPVKV